MTRQLQIEDSGIVSDQDAAYPSVVRLPDGALLAAYTIGQGPLATGGTYFSRSKDGGQTWINQGAILEVSRDPPTRNLLRLSRAPDGKLLAYGMDADRREGKIGFEDQQRRDPVLCTSVDNGRTWSAASKLQTSISGPFEISNPIVCLADGRWLAPAATMPSPERLGERVLVFESNDQGRSWPNHFLIMEDVRKEKGFFEQKLIEVAPGCLIAISWTVRLDGYHDLENHFSSSEDGGRTWTTPSPIGIRGQTMTPFWLGNSRLLLLYNRRYGQQGIVASVVRIDPGGWTIESEDVLWDAGSTVAATSGGGIDALKSFEFGMPGLIRLDRSRFLATHWCREHDNYVARWTRFRLSINLA